VELAVVLTLLVIATAGPLRMVFNKLSADNTQALRAALEAVRLDTAEVVSLDLTGMPFDYGDGGVSSTDLKLKLQKFSQKIVLNSGASNICSAAILVTRDSSGDVDTDVIETSTESGQSCPRVSRALQDAVLVTVRPELEYGPEFATISFPVFNDEIYSIYRADAGVMND